jgi:hypothetical protein
MSCRRTIMLIGVALGLLGKSELLSASESVERVACEGVACDDENLSFEIDYSVCAALIPGYEVDPTKTGTMTALGSTKPLSSLLLIMSVELAADLGFPTQRVENKYGFAIGTSQVVDGEVLINDQALGQPGRDYLKGLCRRFEATKA